MWTIINELSDDNGGCILKKYTKIAYILLVLIVFLSGFFIYKVSGQNKSNENIKEKTISEIKHLENEFQNLFNQFNNISFENYKITSTEIKKEEENEKQLSSSSQKSTSNGGENSGKSEETESSENSEDNKQYKLEEVGVLTESTEIDWKQIKNDVEKIYTSLYPIILDLYQTSTNQQDIANFNKECDNLTKAVKDENKEESLKELSILYDYLTKFAENCTEDEKEKTIIKTKNYIFKAYSVLEKEEWDTVSDNINRATQEFTKIITNINNKESGNQYNINKVYVMTNDLQNAARLKDKEVFLIKYKNLLEELQNI